MEEREVLTKLGFDHEYELRAVEQLKKYTLRYVVDERDSNKDRLKDIYILEDKDPLSSQELIDNYLKVLTTDQPLLPIFYYGKPAGWRAYLDPNRTDQKRWEPPCFKFKPKSVPKTFAYNLFDDKDNKQLLSDKFNIDKGHLLGVFANFFFSFDSFLNENRRVSSNHFNEYPQFKRANRNSNSSTGQVLLEDKIRDNNDKEPFYYEVEAIYADSKDTIPIGTRIRIIKIISHEMKEIKHVFIPNCDYAYCDGESVLTDENEASDYRKFFKDGDLRDLKWKNIVFPEKE